MDIDLLTKFNRGLCLSLIDTNVIEAIRMYREYSSYLHNNDGEEACKKELLTVRAAFLKKLIDFVELEENKTKTGGNRKIPASSGFMILPPGKPADTGDCGW